MTITVKEVNEKPVVKQADEDDETLLECWHDWCGSTMEVSTVCILEDRPPAVKDNPLTGDTDETELDNVVTNNYECDAMDDDIVDYSFTATDGDVTGTLGVITGSAGPESNQVKLSLTGDDAARFELVETGQITTDVELIWKNCQ